MEAARPSFRGALWRFIVACCAAETLPVTVALEGRIPELVSEQLVGAESVFDVAAFSCSAVLLVKAERIVPVNPFVNPFPY